MTATAETPLPTLDTLPPIVRAWILQLTSPEMTAMLAAQPDAQIDVRLSASRGKVRRRPVITLNGGPSDQVPAGEYTADLMS